MDVCDVNFRGGYWSQADKELWCSINWQERNYEDYPIEKDTINGKAYFYSNGRCDEKPVTFIRVLRSNPIYPPYYKPIMTRELREFITGTYVGPMYDGRVEGNYAVHDRYETQEIYNALSN